MPSDQGTQVTAGNITDMAPKNYFDVKKLNGSENYHTWSFAMVNYLEMGDLENCIKAKEDQPNVPVEDKPDRLKKAKNTLVLSVDDSIFVHVRKAKTALEIWTTLKNLYEDNGLLRKIGLLRALISVRLENASSIQCYVDEIMNTSNKLSGIGFDIGDTWIAAILLAGLTDEYKPLIMSIEGSGVDMTADMIKRKLLDNQFEDNSNTSATGYLSRRVAKKEKICYTCGGKNHISIDCTFKRDDDSDTENLSRNRNNRSGKANIVTSNFLTASNSRSVTNNPLGEGSRAACFLTRAVKSSKYKAGLHRGIQSFAPVAPVKFKNSKLLDSGGRNNEKFVSVRETERSSKFDGCVKKREIQNNMASNEVEVIIDRLRFEKKALLFTWSLL